MFSYITNLMGIAPLILKVVRQLKTQRAFIEHALLPILKTMREANDGSSSEDDFKKVQGYYGLGATAILGEAYAALRGIPLSGNERMAATFLGAATGLFDDFFDKKELEDAYIEMIVNHPDQISGRDDFEKLAILCWSNALQYAANQTLLMEAAKGVHDAQIESRKQRNTLLDFSSLKKITFEKGGHSVVFYMSVFYTEMPDDDRFLYYHAGALLQLENDIFDIYKDYQADITTLATKTGRIAPLRKQYLDTWQQVHSATDSTRYPSFNKHLFRKILCAIVSRGMVCLDMLQKLEDKNQGRFDPGIFTRKQLICDMEKPVNLFRTMHYYAKLL